MTHLGLAYKVARGYRAQGNITGLELDDLRQLAVIGLIRASRTFQPALGKWSHYAGRAIRRNIQDFIHRQEILRVPDALEDDEGNQHSWASQVPARPESGLPPGEAQDVRDMLECLSARHREVVALRFGLDGKAEHSVTDIGRQLGITGQGARQILMRALETLREKAGELRSAERCSLARAG